MLCKWLQQNAVHALGPGCNWSTIEYYKNMNLLHSLPHMWSTRVLWWQWRWWWWFDRELGKSGDNITIWWWWWWWWWWRWQFGRQPGESDHNVTREDATLPLCGWSCIASWGAFTQQPSAPTQIKTNKDFLIYLYGTDREDGWAFLIFMLHFLIAPIFTPGIVLPVRNNWKEVIHMFWPRRAQTNHALHDLNNSFRCMSIYHSMLLQNIVYQWPKNRQG